MLSTLHEGKHGLLIIPLFAGLANSRKLLVQRGISRIGPDYIHTIGSLEPGQPGEAVRMMLKRFRVDLASADTRAGQHCSKRSAMACRRTFTMVSRLLQKLW